MTKVIEAIYTNGRFEPAEPVELAEQQRVRLTVETLDGRSEADRARAVQELIERLKQSTFAYGGPLPTRDELHER